jgi:ribosomal protein L28
MARCDNCGKKTQIGRQSKHKRGVASKKFRKKATKKSKSFKPNIQKTTIRVGGLKMSMKLCTTCIKTMKKRVAQESKKVKEKKPAAKEESKPRKETKKSGKQNKTAKK